MVLIYLVLAAQFQSFRDPLIVLLGSVPLAISGALIFSFLGLTTINIYSQVGLITLVGLIAKNGILIVQFANTLQQQGLDKIAAVREAASTRLRPVLMTSVATVLGHFPLVLVSGPGSQARNSIGTVLVAGMAIGTVFTLFVVPVFYSLIAAQHVAERRRGARRLRRFRPLSSYPRSRCREHSTTNPRRRAGARRGDAKRGGAANGARATSGRALGDTTLVRLVNETRLGQPRHSDRVGARRWSARDADECRARAAAGA